MESLTFEKICVAPANSLICELASISERAFASSVWLDDRRHLGTLTYLISITNFDLFVARWNGQLIGFSIGCVIDNENVTQFGKASQLELWLGGYLLAWAAVLPEFRNMGIGSELLKLRILASAHCQVVYAVTRHDNYHALRLYRKNGLELFKTINCYGRKGLYSLCWYRRYWDR